MNSILLALMSRPAFYRGLFLIGVQILFLVPTLVSAQGFVPCSGTDCTFCDFADMANTILVWLIGFMFIIFAIIMLMAGFGLVTSGGNPSAKSAAKDKFMNAIVGLIIVLSAWLIVDTIMRGVLADRDGTIDGWGPWSEVRCWGEQRETSRTEFSWEGRGDSLAGGIGAGWGTSTDEIGEGEEGIVDFAEAMDAQNCLYSQRLRNGCQGNPGYTDCSDLVNVAYQAAGCNSPGTYTGDMIGNARPFNSPSELRAGDALIHRTNGRGHIVICKDDGCDRVIHAQGSRTGIVESNGSSYYNDPRYTSAIRASDYCP